MAGDALVIGDRLELERAPHRRIGGVEEEAPRLGAVPGRSRVEGQRPLLDRVGHAGRLGKDPEPIAHGRRRLGEGGGGVRHEALGIAVMERLVVAELPIDLVDLGRAEERSGDLAVFLLEPLDLLDGRSHEPPRR